MYCIDISIALLIFVCFFILIVPFRYILTLFTNNTHTNAYKLAHIIGLAGVCILFLAGIQDLTIDPQSHSGNGNLALIVIIPFLMVLTIYLTALFLFMRNVSLRKFKPVLFGIVFFLISFSLARMWQNSSELLFILGGGPEEPDSKIYRYPWLNQYTNTLFFNGYLFLFLSSLAVLGSSIFSEESR